MGHKIRNKALVLLTLLQPVALYAQQTDTLAALRQFIQVGNSYKQVPMYADIVIHNRSNFVTSKEDTATFEAAFYVLKDSAYIKYGDVEQLVNDSLMLMVNNSAQKMLLFPNKQPIASRLDQYLGVLGDSSLQRMAARYTASILPIKNGIAAIEVRSRATAYGTALPKERILMKYTQATGVLTEVVQERQKLVKLDSLQYNSMLQDTAYKGRLLASEHKGFYLVKNVSTIYVCKEVYGGNVRLPVLMSDRIVKDSNRNYVAAKGYEGFTVQQQQR